MKQFLLLFFFATTLSINGFSQSTGDSITITNFRGDIKCYRKGVYLTQMDYKVILKDTPDALNEYLRAQSNYKSGTIVEYIGGFVFGFCLGSAISGEKIDYTWWLTLGSGAAVASVGILIYNTGKSHHRNAVSLYNASLKPLSYKPEHVLEFGPEKYGLGLAYKF